MPVDERELRATVQQMEKRLRAEGDSRMEAYDALTPRFRADLDDERDELLAPSATLMLIQELRDRSGAANR